MAIERINQIHKLFIQRFHPQKSSQIQRTRDELNLYLPSKYTNIFQIPALQIMNTQKNLTLKYLVVGDSGVGKTSLLVRYCQDGFQADYLSTIGVDFKIKRAEVNGCQVTLNIWDTAGQQRFKNITKSFYKGAHGIILTYSITDPNSYAHIENWIEQIREAGNVETNMILVATKTDMESDRKVTRKHGETLAQRYKIKFIETSAKNSDNVGKIFQELTADIVVRHEAQDRLKQNKEANKTALEKKKEQNKKGDCC